MTSENYRQLLNKEYEDQEMTKEDFDSTLMHFAMLYHKEQLRISVNSGVFSDEQIKAIKVLLWILDGKHNVSIPQTQENINFTADQIVKLLSIPA